MWAKSLAKAFKSESAVNLTDPHSVSVALTAPPLESGAQPRADRRTSSLSLIFTAAETIAAVPRAVKLLRAISSDPIANPPSALTTEFAIKPLPARIPNSPLSATVEFETIKVEAEIAAPAAAVAEIRPPLITIPVAATAGTPITVSVPSPENERFEKPLPSIPGPSAAVKKVELSAVNETVELKMESGEGALIETPPK
jgi:hypothetical protein